MKQTQQIIFGAVVEQVEELSAEVHRITFHVQDNFSFQPGQYIWVELLTMKFPDTRGSRRAFSISSIPNQQNTVTITVRKTQSGFSQNMFGLVKHDKVRIHGPFGSSFTLAENYPTSIVMIAGGVGISPFLSVLLWLQEQPLPIKIFLCWLAQADEVPVFNAQLEQIKQRLNNFQYLISDYQFKYDQLLSAGFDQKKNSSYWICGSHRMVDQTYALLTDQGISRDNMVFEHFYPSVSNGLTLEQINQQMQSGGLLNQVIQNSSNHIVITDPNGFILFANEAAEELTGYTLSEMIGQTPRLWGGLMSKEFYQEFWKRKTLGEVKGVEITNRKKNGEIYHAIANISPIYDLLHQVIGYIGTEHDVTQLVQKNYEQENFINMMSARNVHIQQLEKQNADLKSALDTVTANLPKT